MEKRNKRTVFVCVAISPAQQLLTQVISASTSQLAVEQFQQQFSILPQRVLGPFSKKQKTTLPLNSGQAMKFIGKTVKAIYNGWKVDAFLLADPLDHAFLIFHNRIDGQNVSMPSGTVVVATDQLQII